VGGIDKEKAERESGLLACVCVSLGGSSMSCENSESESMGVLRLFVCCHLAAISRCESV